MLAKLRPREGDRLGPEHGDELSICLGVHGLCFSLRIRIGDRRQNRGLPGDYLDGAVSDFDFL